MTYLEELKKCNTEIYPIRQLINTIEKNFNWERLNSLKELKSNLVYNSVIRQLEILETKETKYKDLISEVILWNDIAKVGDSKERKIWKVKGYNLHTHNEGSSDIYKENTKKYNHIIYILIKTHGLIGQYIQGEVTLKSNIELYSLIKENYIQKEELKEILLILNECIVKEVSEKLYERIREDIEKTIIKVVNGQLDEEENIINRLTLLNEKLSNEDIKLIENILENKEIKNRLELIFNNCELWYYKSSLKSYKIEEQIKILLIISNNINNITKITFYDLMKNMYLDYKDIKRENIYKQRIIECYLKELTYEEILNNEIKSNINISYITKKNNNILEFNFLFSKVAKKLIEFCEVAYNSGTLYNKSVILLYDLFGFRKDNYDRFYNEMDYLQTMNSTINHKSKLLEFIKGDNVLDVGPGGGALMDLILESLPNKTVYGIDISENVINVLNEKKLKENKNYNLVKGNALNLEDYFKQGELDTIIYSSVIHELFSYVDYNGKKFNHETIKKALTSAYNILSPGGRIVIRDGIMSETNPQRIIEFKNKEDINILKKYQKDFKGRKIKFEIIDQNKVKMNENDSMEFLYTYTWGENSYPLEVQEQYGYYSPKEYEKFVTENLKNSKIIFSHAFLQDGYEEHLLNKIAIYEENFNTVKLPNSTYILVIEKGE